MIELPGRFLHLLSQKVKRRQFFTARFIDKQIDVIAVSSSSPESKNAAGCEQIFGCDFIQDLLRIVKEFPRLLADCRIVKDRRIPSAQFPNMKKRRPIDILAKIDNRRVNLASASEVRLRWNVTGPSNRCSIFSRFLERE